MKRAETLHRHLSIDQKKVEFGEEQLRTQVPDFWKDPKRAQGQMIKAKGTEEWLVDYQQVRQLADRSELAFNFYCDEVITEDELDAGYTKAVAVIERLEMKNMFRQTEDPVDCVMEINSRAGGTRSQNWAQMLMRMYVRWVKARDYKCTISDIQDGDEVGIKGVTIKIEGGEYAYGYLKSENGIHRLVRISPFNAQGKRTTSFAGVFVSPLVNDTIRVFVDPARASWDTFRSSGAGGQNVNEVKFGVRLRHQYEDPDTGEGEEILIKNTEIRNQPEDRARAIQLLKSQLYDRVMKKRLEAQAKIEVGKKRIEWGSQIQSYVFDDRRVKDHRTNHQTTDIDAAANGKLDKFIKVYLMEFPVVGRSD